MVMAAVLGAPAPAALAQAKGKVTEYGVYGADNTLVKRTREIATGKPVRFGFCFEAPIDAENGGVALVETLSHPPMKQANGIETAGYSLPRMFKVEGGVVRGCAGYQAKTPEDLSPGTWRFTLSDGGVDVVVQEFEIKDRR